MDLLLQGRNLCLSDINSSFLNTYITYIPNSTTRFKESLDIPNIPITLTLYMTTPHQPKQIKSYWYYTFWSIATLAVVLGQIYVATGYRYLAEALKASIL